MTLGPDTADPTCPNCGRLNPERFCGECGQGQGPLLPSFREWTTDVLDELFFVSGRLPASLRLLAWPPGQVTTEWSAGRRARYLHPFRLYLVGAALFFLTSSLAGSGGSFVEGAASGAAQAFLEGAPGEDQAVANALRWWPRIVLVIMVPTTALVLQHVLRDVGRGFIEHMVFSLHMHALLYLLLTAGLVAGAALSWLSADSWSQGAQRAQLFPYPVGLVLFGAAIRRHYGAGRGRTVFAAVGTAAAYLTAMIFVLMAVVLLSSASTAS